MWQDALRVCKDYIPNKLPLLQEEYDRTMATESTKYVDCVVYCFFGKFSVLVFMQMSVV